MGASRSCALSGWILKDLFNRRKFLEAGLLLGSGAIAAGGHRMDSHREPALIRPENLEPFVDPLPIPHIAQPTGTKASPFKRKARCRSYRLPIYEFSAKVHR